METPNLVGGQIVGLIIALSICGVLFIIIHFTGGWWQQYLDTICG